MWRKSLISHINQTDIAHPAEESRRLWVSSRATIRGWPPSSSRSLLPLFRWASDEWNSSTCNPPNIKPLAGPRPAPPLPLEKDLPLLPSSQAKEKKSQFELWMVEQIIICQIPTYHICFWSLYIGGLIVLIYVTFFHHIYDMNIWKLKNVIPVVLFGYCSQADLCIQITLWKLASTFRNWANLYAIHPWNFFYILTFHYKNQMANLSHLYWKSTWGVGGELYTEVPSSIFLATKFCIVLIFFL
jgi:hypothetical protein